MNNLNQNLEIKQNWMSKMTVLGNNAKNLLWYWQIYQIAQVIKWKVHISFFQETYICLENYDYLLITTKNF